MTYHSLSAAELWLLPLFATIVFFGTYAMDRTTCGYSKAASIREASWWCAGFFIYALADYLFLLH